jgi:hypothetical protein
MARMLPMSAPLIWGLVQFAAAILVASLLTRMAARPVEDFWTVLLSAIGGIGLAGILFFQAFHFFHIVILKAAARRRE